MAKTGAGRAVAVRDPTDMQAEFAREYARNGGRGAEAARKAGFSARVADRYAYQLLEKPHVQAAILKEQRRLLQGLASLAIDQARAMLDNPQTPAGARAQIITAVLDRAGLAPVKAGEDDGDPAGRDLRELSTAELEAIVAKRFGGAKVAGGSTIEAEPAETAADAPTDEGAGEA
jgi:hypothetical protein